MKAAAATTGMLSAAALLSSGCGEPARTGSGDRDEPVRRASFRSLAARDFLLTCPAAAAARRETRYQAGRFEELKQLAIRNGAGQAIWLGENDWAGVSRYADREPCEAGEEPYRQALAAYGGALDRLAGAIAEHPR
jgi:hypothetical protein